MKWHLFAAIIAVSTLVGFGVTLPSAESTRHQTSTRSITPPPQQEGETLFQKTVNYWIEQLAQQKGFESWKNARWSSESLGAQMHSWVVDIRQNDKIIGYMVMGADASGSYRLLEYGNGPYPLFGTSLLTPYLENLGIDDKQAQWTRIYHQPLESLWYAQTAQGDYVFDAKSGEYYELDEEKLRGLIQLPESAGLPGIENEYEAQTVHARMNIEEAVLTSSFDPFMSIPWVRQQPLSVDSPKLLIDALKSGHELTYTQRIIAGEMMLPFAVHGVHVWSDDNRKVYYFAVDQEGQRFIPYVHMMEKGQLYSELIESS